MGKKRFWILIGIGSFLVIFFILLSNVIDVGLKLREISPYLEYGFYGLSAILFYVLIVNPIRVIVLSPTFTVDAMLTDDGKRHKIYKDAAAVLLKNSSLTDDDKTLLRTNMSSHDGLRESLQTVFTRTLKPQMNEVIVKNAKSVLVTTALSQNGNFDMISVLAINLRMIKEIVEVSGFRPSYPYLAKLSMNVMITSLIAEGIEEIDLSKVMPAKIGETLGELPFLKTISSSIVGGTTNSLLTCRVGIITQKFLYNDNQLLDKHQIRVAAYKDAVMLMPRIVTEGLVSFPKSVVNFAMKPFEKQSKQDDEE